MNFMEESVKKGFYTQGGHNLRFFLERESSICDRGYYKKCSPLGEGGTQRRATTFYTKLGWLGRMKIEI